MKILLKAIVVATIAATVNAECCSSTNIDQCCTQRCNTVNCCPAACDTKPAESSTTEKPTENITPQKYTSGEEDKPYIANVTNEIHNTNDIAVNINLSFTNIANMHVSNEDVVETISSIPTSSSYPTTTGIITTVTTLISETDPTPTRFPCCTAIEPCYLNICQRQVCGPWCNNPYVYMPINPCPIRGCYRRQYWSKYYCNGRSPCDHMEYDCSKCNVNTFYTNYRTYSSCYGCFY